MTKLRKGGDARYVISAVAQNDTFTIPRGFKVREIINETTAVTTTAPNVTIGVTPVTQQVGTITVAGVAGAASTVFSIGGVASGTQIAISNTVAQTVALIQTVFGPGGASQAALLNAGWTLTSFNTVSGVIGFSGSPGKTSTAPVIVTTSLTVQTVVSAVTVNGVVDTTIMTSQALNTTAYTIKDLTTNIASGKNFRAANSFDVLTLTFTTTSTQAGYYVLNGVQSPLIASGQTTSQIVTTLSGMKVPGYTLSPSSNVLTVTSQTNGAGLPQPTFYTLPATPVLGTTWTVNFAPEDTVCYIGIDLNGIGNNNFYVVLQKLN